MNRNVALTFTTLLLTLALSACGSSSGGGGQSPVSKSWAVAEKIEVENLGNVISTNQLVTDSNGIVTVIWEQNNGVIDNLWANRYTPGVGWGIAEKIETEDFDDANSRYIHVDDNNVVTAIWKQRDATRSNLWANRYTPGAGWAGAVKIENDDLGGVSYISSVMDSVGNINVVWSQSDGVRTNFWANRYTVGSGWGVAEKIETEDLGNATIARVVVDTNGNVMAVWTQDNGATSNAWANRYSIATDSWGVAEKIESDAGFVITPQIIVDGAGNVTAVWRQDNLPFDNLWANRYDVVANAWGTAEKIETENLGTAFSAVLNIDTGGNVTAIWPQNDGTRDNLWANRYTVGSGWGVAEKIEVEDLGNISFQKRLVVDNNNNVTAVWSQNNGARDNLWANRYTAGVGWGVAGKIETEDLGNTTLVNVLIDNSGNITPIWLQNDGLYNNLWANRYSTGSGWGAAEKIDTEDLGSMFFSNQVLDSAGNITTVWSQSDGVINNFWTNRYTVGSGWGVAGKIETEDLGDVKSGRLVIDSSDNITAVWSQNDGVFDNLWSNTFR